MASMKDKVIAISGGSSGMGLALSKLLASRGAKLSICDISQPNLDKASREIETKDLLTFKCNVRNISEVQAWINETVSKFGRVDGAANMAGIVGARPGANVLAEQDEDDWDRVIGINLTVPIPDQCI